MSTELDLVAAFARSLANVPYAAGGYPNYGSLQMRSWIQSWSNTSCGFGGFAGQGFTDALVVVAWYGPISDANLVVSVGGSLAYVVKKEDPRHADFHLQIEGCCVPGQDRWQRACTHRYPQHSNQCDFCRHCETAEERDARKSGER